MSKTYIDGLKAAREIVDQFCGEVWRSTDHNSTTAQLIFRNAVLSNLELARDDIDAAISEAENETP